MEVLGIDIGGTGIKGAIVNVNTGELLTERLKHKTPTPASPESVVEAVKKLVNDIGYKGDVVGFGFPSIVHNGVCKSASNIDPTWIDVDLVGLFSKELNKQCIVINDADAAGVAELTLPAYQNIDGTVILITLGTGIGSAMMFNHNLLPNTEFGHLDVCGVKAEKFASNKIRLDENLSYEDWGMRVNKVLEHLEHIFSPEAIVIGGGVSKKFDKYQQYLHTNSKLSQATLLNNAGIIGAAKYAYDRAKS